MTVERKTYERESGFVVQGWGKIIFLSPLTTSQQRRNRISIDKVQGNLLIIFTISFIWPRTRVRRHELVRDIRLYRIMKLLVYNYNNLPCLNLVLSLNSEKS